MDVRRIGAERFLCHDPFEIECAGGSLLILVLGLHYVTSLPSLLRRGRYRGIYVGDAGSEQELFALAVGETPDDQNGACSDGAEGRTPKLEG